MVGKLIGKYQVISELAQGRLGPIYRAQLANQPPDPQREILLKAVNFNLFTKSLQVQLKARFRREIYAQRQLQHRNIVPVYELLNIGNDYFVALEHFPGATLRDLLMRQGVPNAVEAVSYGRQMLAALDYAHRLNYQDESDFPRTGIVHGDIRLSNLLLDARGRIKLTDFSIIHKVIGGELRKVYPDLVAYQSPEMQRGHAPDFRSDIFAAGSVFYEMLTGRLPSVATHNEDWRYAKPETGDSEAEALMAIRPDVPVALATAISRAVRRNPQDRFATMGDFLKAVQAVESQLGDGETVPRIKPSTGSLPSLSFANEMPSGQALLMNASGGLDVQRPSAMALKQPTAMASAARVSTFAAQPMMTSLPGDVSFDVAPPSVKKPRRERWVWPAFAACALGGILAGAYFFTSPRSLEGMASTPPVETLAAAVNKNETATDVSGEASAAPALSGVTAKEAPSPSATLESPKLALARQAEQQERYSEALQAYEEFALANPNMAAATNLGVRIAGLRQYLARIASGKEAYAAARYDEARAHFNEALKLRPSSKTAQAGLREAGSHIATPLTVPAIAAPVAAKRDNEESKENKENKENKDAAAAPRPAGEEKELPKEKKEVAKPMPIVYRPTKSGGATGAGRRIPASTASKPAPIKPANTKATGAPANSKIAIAKNPSQKAPINAGAKASTATANKPKP